MNEHTTAKEKVKGKRWILHLVALAVLLFSFYQVTRTLLEVPREFSVGSAQPFQAVVDRKDDRLVDAVLSIGPRYYVDRERWDDPARIFDELLLNLQAVENLSCKVVAEDSQFRTFSVNNSEPKKFSLPNDYSELKLALQDLSAYIKSNSKFSSAKKSATLLVLNTLLRSMDPHSVLLSQNAYEDLKQGTEGHFGGLGVLVGVRDRLLTVLKPMTKSPAEKAGVKPDEAIVAINQQPTFGLNIDDLVLDMRGEPGSEVELTLLDRRQKKSRHLRVAREIIDVEPVQAKLLDYEQNHFLHLTIESFSKNTSRDLQKYLRDFYSRGVRPDGIILDLRSNPGGLLDQAIESADIFLKEGPIVITKGNEQEVVEPANDDGDEPKGPMVVLVDGQSASASEILAGALQDLDRATIIGQSSFGKGSVQTVFELPEKKALKITVARYYTPSGRSIQNIGIRPDVMVQPIVGEANLRNPFGYGHLQKEAELAHHLVVNQPTEAAEQWGNYAPLYYWVDSEQVKRREDFELNLAQKVLSRSIEVAGQKDSINLERAAFVAASSSGLLKKVALQEMAKVRKNIKKKTKIDWRGNEGDYFVNTVSNFNKTQFTASAEVSENDSRAILIPWKVENNGDNPLRGLSVYLRYDNTDFEPFEFLLPDIGPHEKKEGRFTERLGRTLKPGSYGVRIGLSSHMQAINGLVSKAHFTVGEVQTTKIQIESQLVRRSLANNTYDLNLELRNTGLVPLKSGRIEVTDLNGGEVLIPDPVFKLIKTIIPGDSFHLSFKVEVPQWQTTENLYFGAVLESESLEQDILQSIFVAPEKSEQLAKKVWLGSKKTENGKKVIDSSSEKAH